MKLYYISPRDMRKNRADCVSIMKSCHEFSRNGFDVTLVTPRVFRHGNVRVLDEVWDLYGLPKTFKIIELPTVLRDETLTALARSQKFILFLIFYLYLLAIGRADGGRTLFYSRCYISIIPAILLRRLGILRSRLGFDVSVYVKNKPSHRFVAKNVDKLVIFNTYIMKKYRQEYQVEPERILKADYPSQYNQYRANIDRVSDQIRQSLVIADGASLVTYGGKIAPDRVEVKYILQAAKLCPECEFLLVGCKDDFMAYYTQYMKTNKINNARFIGFQPLQDFYRYLAVSDLLLSYYDSHDEISKYQRVPAKSTIYTCTGKPIIFADLPSLREWFSEDIVFFVPPDQPDLLAARIKYVIDHPAEARKRAQNCLDFAKRYTYERSLRRIGVFLSSSSQAIREVQHESLPRTICNLQ